jgi:hypothetical protein
MEQLLMTPEYLEDLLMFDETEEMEWIGAMNGMLRIRDPVRKGRTCAADLEPLFQNDRCGGILAAVNGHTWLEGRLGIPGATSREWHDKHRVCRAWSPWIDARKRTSAKVSAKEDCRLIRDHLIRNSRMRNREVTAPDIPSILQDVESVGPRGIVPAVVPADGAANAQSLEVVLAKSAQEEGARCEPAGCTCLRVEGPGARRAGHSEGQSEGS